MNNSKVISVRKIYDEVDKLSKTSNITKARLIELAWEEFKKSKKYSKICLGLEKIC